MLADIYRISTAAGPVAVGVAVSVGAYLLGVAAASMGLGLTYLIGRLLCLTVLGGITPGYRRGTQVRNALRELVTERITARVRDDPAFRSAVIDAVERVGLPKDIRVMPETRTSLEELALSSGYARYRMVQTVG